METNKSSWKRKILIVLLLLTFLVLGGTTAFYYMPYSSNAVRAGQLNYVMYKGVIFKTYEGKLIQTGIKSGTTGGVESNAFEFSIRDKETFDKLEKVAGKYVTVRYKEYYGALPWRGFTKYIVDEIISVEEVDPAHTIVDPNVFNGQ